MINEQEAYVFETILMKMEELFPNMKNKLSYCAPEYLGARIYQMTGINIEEIVPPYGVWAQCAPNYLLFNTIVEDT